MYGMTNELTTRMRLVPGGVNVNLKASLASTKNYPQKAFVQVTQGCH